MSHPPKQHLIRIGKIKHYLLDGRNLTEIAGLCGVSRRTIYRDIEAWVDTGDFEAWLAQEWLHIHQCVKQKDLKEVYRQLSGMMKRRMKQKVEADVKETIIIQSWDPDAEDSS